MASDPKATGEIDRPHAWTGVTGTSQIKSLKCSACEVLAFGGDLSGINPRCPGNEQIFIRLDGDYSLAVGQVWPDGDYPDEITAEAVAALMKQQGRWELSNDWDLTPDFHVAVGRGPEVRVDV